MKVQYDSNLAIVLLSTSSYRQKISLAPEKAARGLEWFGACVDGRTRPEQKICTPY